jgi:hypothetical protein
VSGKKIENPGNQKLRIPPENKKNKVTYYEYR